MLIVRALWLVVLSNGDLTRLTLGCKALMWRGFRSYDTWGAVGGGVAVGVAAVSRPVCCACVRLPAVADLQPVGSPGVPGVLVAAWC